MAFCASRLGLVHLALVKIFFLLEKVVFVRLGNAEIQPGFLIALLLSIAKGHKAPEIELVKVTRFNYTEMANGDPAFWPPVATM